MRECQREPKAWSEIARQRGCGASTAPQCERTRAWWGMGTRANHGEQTRGLVPLAEACPYCGPRSAPPPKERQARALWARATTRAVGWGWWELRGTGAGGRNEDRRASRHNSPPVGRLSAEAADREVEAFGLRTSTAAFQNTPRRGRLRRSSNLSRGGAARCRRQLIMLAGMRRRGRGGGSFLTS